MRIKKGDKVIVRRGALKGQTGIVSAIHPKLQKVTIDGINVVKRHRKQTATQQSGVFEQTQPIDVSKVGLIHPTKKNLASRVGYKVNAKGDKTRVYKANDKEIK